MSDTPPAAPAPLPKRARAGWKRTGEGLAIVFAGQMIFLLYLAFLVVTAGLESSAPPANPSGSPAKRSELGAIESVVLTLSPILLAALVVVLGRVACAACPEPKVRVLATISGIALLLASTFAVTGMAAVALRTAGQSLSDFGVPLLMGGVLCWLLAEALYVWGLATIGEKLGALGVTRQSHFLAGVAIMAGLACGGSLLGTVPIPQGPTNLYAPPPPGDPKWFVLALLATLACVALLTLWCAIVTGMAASAAKQTALPPQEST